MSEKELYKKYLFIDESGDPIFYGNRKKLLVGTDGFQPYLIIGMIETLDRKALRKAVVGFMETIKADRLYNSIPSINADKGWYVHAEFYFDALHHLLNGRLAGTDCSYNLYLSQRGNNSLHRFQAAVDRTLETKGTSSKGSMKYNLEIVPSKEMPELSVIDYLMWAVQRKLLTGESRYFDALQSKYETIVNLYDNE